MFRKEVKQKIASASNSPRLYAKAMKLMRECFPGEEQQAIAEINDAIASDLIVVAGFEDEEGDERDMAEYASLISAY